MCFFLKKAIAGDKLVHSADNGQTKKEHIMSKYEAPRSDAERLTVIRRSIETGQADRLAGLNYLDRFPI